MQKLSITFKDHCVFTLTLINHVTTAEQKERKAVQIHKS